MVSLQKNALFCDGEVFFVDRGLLMGAIEPTILNHNVIACMLGLSQDFKDLDIYGSIADIPTLQIQYFLSYGEILRHLILLCLQREYLKMAGFQYHTSILNSREKSVSLFLVYSLRHLILLRLQAE
jgi:hypothetical protein